MKGFLNWSGGKDSAMCLYEARRQGLSIDALVTTLSQATDRITMHGVRRALLECQAASVGLPLHTVLLPEGAGIETYGSAISASNQALRAEGFTQAVFGDLFLEDLKQYRETLYACDGLQTAFPLWQMDTRRLLEDLISLGFKAVVVCVNAALLPPRFCGRIIDASFLHDLPAGVDPCGERGEYHSFVVDGPGFKTAVPYALGELVYQEYPAPATRDDCFTTAAPAAGFWFQDLLPV